MEQKINKQMTFGDVLSKYPKTAEVFFKYGMHCFGCHIATEEPIEQGALAHGVEVDKLIDDLNKAIAEEKSGEQEK